MFFGNLLKKGVLRGFKHPNMPVAVDLTELSVTAAMTSFRALPYCAVRRWGSQLGTKVPRRTAFIALVL
jgi:hypothetical protein